MVYLAAGWAFVVTFLLLAAETNNPLPFAITLVLLVIMISLRSYFTFKDELRLAALLDVVLSILLTAVSVVFLGNTLLAADFYVASWADVFKPQVLIFIGLNLVLLVPFVIVSIMSLVKSLQHLADKKK